MTTASRWTRHFVYRSEHARTTWKLRLGVLALGMLGLWFTSGWWTTSIARSLVCEPSAAPSDAILVENFDPDYLLFERAARLRRAGLAPRVLVPVWTDRGTLVPNAVGLGTAQVMAGISRIGTIEIIPTRQSEPITLGAAHDAQRFLEREHIRSVIVVTPLFRSRRSDLVYAVTLRRAGITVRCDPVRGPHDVRNWSESWHGIQEVTEQWLKLLYYRVYALPFLNRPRG